MNDIDIIKRLENILKIKLEKLDKIERTSIGYLIDTNKQLIGLSLAKCDIENKKLKQIIFLLYDLKYLTELNLCSNQIVDISFLKKLENLTTLNLYHTQIYDISTLKDLKKLTQLDLSGNGIIDISALKGMNSLRYLNLCFNKISDISFLKELRSLQVLNLSNNNINDISFLINLENISKLLLMNNKLEDISPLKDLNGITKLRLGNNQICDITPLKEFDKIEELDLSCNKIIDISPLKSLTSLTGLSLMQNKIKDISFLKDLQYINWLDLVRNKISDISPIKDLRSLSNLSLGNNPIRNISPLEELRKLKLLNLDSTQVRDISSLKDLMSLRVLVLCNNQIRDISPLKDLKHLSKLDLRNNPIKKLPAWITEFNMEILWNKEQAEGGSITLYDDILRTPPVEIMKLGKKAIKRYFKKIEEEGVDHIYEVKLILVGEGASGKTSLQIRLLDEEKELPKEEDRTRGIKIEDWYFKNEIKKKHIAHIWDFGGQDVYYPVHRFFLTENSVFVLLASTRITQHNFDYWIPTIFQFGGRSPIILGQTSHKGNKVAWNDIGSFLSNTNFNIVRTQLIPYYQLNLPNKNEGLDAIKRTIIEQILKLPHYGKGVPKSWIWVRQELTRLAKDVDFISYERFEEICTESSPKHFEKPVDIEDCARFFHSIGIILWYYNFEELRNTIILKPEWALNAVYKLIDDYEIQERHGIILAKDFDRLWDSACYQDKHLVLKKMLEVFRIAFRKKHKEEYIIPARLLSIPDEERWKDFEPYLRLEYRYEFMPRGLVNQLSAELSKYILSDKRVWNDAVNFGFDYKTGVCQIKEDFYNRKISIKTKGKDARALNMLVMDTLKNITDGYKGVVPQIVVPCTCKKCEISVKPTIFYYEDLLRWSAARESATVYCNEGSENLSIEELLFTVGLHNPIKEQMEKKQSKPFKIFIASSSELKDDRKEFELAIRQKNDNWVKKGIYLQPVMWENFIDSISQTRLQDEYNNATKESDIFVMLFFTKVGKFTAEEFEKAFGQFKITGKPFIYTYFKNNDIKSGSLKKEDTLSLFAFQDKLKELGHYQTEYMNTEALILHFFNQIEKLGIMESDRKTLNSSRI
jgi:internalin A